MPTPTTNQGIPQQLGADPANLPGAQAAWDGVMENRLAQRYANLATRTANNPAPNENEISSLVAEDRVEVFDAVNWISLHARSVFQSVRRSTDAAAISNSTTLVNDGTLVTVLPAVTGVFRFRDVIVYSSSQVADYKVAYTFPGTGWYGASSGLSIGAAGTTGDCQSAVANVSGTAIPYGGAAVGTRLMLVIDGEVTLAGVGGNLQLQYAQNTLEVSNTIPAYAGSSREIWRVS